MKPLKTVLAKKGDPRITQVYKLANSFIDAFRETGYDRDILTTAIGLVLAHMYVEAGADETFAKFAVSEQLAGLVVGNMPMLRKLKNET
jgi:hypothetical protein